MDTTHPIDTLRPKEREYLGYATIGRTNKEIAYLFRISITTVNHTLGKAYAKLGLDDDLSNCRIGAALLFYDWATRGENG